MGRGLRWAGQAPGSCPPWTDPLPHHCPCDPCRPWATARRRLARPGRAPRRPWEAPASGPVSGGVWGPWAGGVGAQVAAARPRQQDRVRHAAAAQVQAHALCAVRWPLLPVWLCTAEIRANLAGRAARQAPACTPAPTPPLAPCCTVPTAPYRAGEAWLMTHRPPFQLMPP